MKIKKIIQILLICLILAGIIVIATAGFNVGLKYSENTQININLNKEFDISDIKKITKEVFPNQSVIIQQVELYKDMVQITVKNASDEQIESLNTKINEKYELSNTIDNGVAVTKNANTKLRYIAKPYLLPLTILVALIIAYAEIRFNKIGMWKVLYKILLAIIGSQAILFSVYAIIRIPVNEITVIVSIMLYMISVLVEFWNLTKLNETRIVNQKVSE